MVSQNISGKDELVNITTPGVQLRQAREGLGKSPRDVAEHLCLSTQFIDALEKDRYEDLPGEVFIRGYLRNYADFVNLNPNEIVSLFDRLGFVDKGRTPQQVRLELQQQPITTNDGVVRTVTYLIILSLLVLVFLWWHSQNSLNPTFITSNNSAAENPPVPMNPTAIQQQVSPDVPPATATNTPVPGTPTAPLVNPNEATSVMSNIPVPPPSPAQQAAGTATQPVDNNVPVNTNAASNNAAPTNTPVVNSATTDTSTSNSANSTNAQATNNSSTNVTDASKSEHAESIAAEAHAQDDVSDNQEASDDEAPARHARRHRHRSDDYELETPFD